MTGWYTNLLITCVKYSDESKVLSLDPQQKSKAEGSFNSYVYEDED